MMGAILMATNHIEQHHIINCWGKKKRETEPTPDANGSAVAELDNRRNSFAHGDISVLLDDGEEENGDAGDQQEAGGRRYGLRDRQRIALPTRFRDN